MPAFAVLSQSLSLYSAGSPAATRITPLWTTASQYRVVQPNSLVSISDDQQAGRSMSTVIDGKIVSVAEARRMVAYARAQGWLS